MSDVTGLMLWGLLGGMTFGTVPVLAGAIKHKMRLGIIGFLACSVAGAFLGLLLAIPVCCVFVYLIVKKGKASAS